MSSFSDCHEQCATWLRAQLHRCGKLPVNPTAPQVPRSDAAITSASPDEGYSEVNRRTDAAQPGRFVTSAGRLLIIGDFRSEPFATGIVSVDEMFRQLTS